MLGIFIMFIILFKNLKLALIGVVPNFIAAFFILGLIGLLGIPLDMMTITIAAKNTAIAVLTKAINLNLKKKRISYKS